MKKLLKTLAVVAVFGVVLYAFGAFAQQTNSNSGGLHSVTLTLANLFEEVKTVFFVLAAFGIIGLAAAALLGKVQWKWLFALVFGVAIVGAAGYIVSYAAGTGDKIEGISDTSLDGN